MKQSSFIIFICMTLYAEMLMAGVRMPGIFGDGMVLQRDQPIAVWGCDPKGNLQISPNGRYLQYEDGTPFFWLGDTAWELFHRLTIDEIEKYLDNRKEKGFNVIQVTILAETDGLRNPNRYGEVPLVDMDPRKPNEKYFELIDSVIQMASDRNMFIGLLPTWGDKVLRLWGIGPEIFDIDNAYIYGRWLAERYRDKNNIIWILGGDRPPVSEGIDVRPVWRSMAQGILDGSNEKALISYHINGGEASTSQFIHNEEWLHINQVQSGHGLGHDVPVWEWITRDHSMEPAKPTLDSEPCYEDHPVNPWPVWNPENGYFRDYDVRKQTYRSVFAGACGVTYGHHSIWQFWSPLYNKINHADRYWDEALDRPGAFQVGYLRKLIESRPSLDRVPDQSIIEQGQGEKGEYSCAFRDEAGTYLMAYIPVGKTITVNTSSIKSEQIKVWWFNPQTAESVTVGNIKNTGSLMITPPIQGIGNDWVLVVNHPKYNTGVL